MKERPILMNAPMVRATLDGTKTQTRRVVKDPGLYAINADIHGLETAVRELAALATKCPYGQPGDQLWVRETFTAYGRWVTRYSEKKARDEWHFIDMTQECDRAYQYAADSPDVPLATGRGGMPGWWTRPAIFMPRAVSRITREITSVRVERLQDISEADCWSEGIEACDGLLDDVEIINCAKRMKRSFEDAAPTYAALWESINGSGSWDINPFVWVIEFKLVTP